jgi:outer membrane protein TolC
MHAVHSSARRSSMRCPAVSMIAVTCLLVLAAAGVPLAARAQTGLSLAAAVQLATRESRLVAAAEAQARSAREMAVAAGQRPDPVLRAGITNVPIDGADRFSLTRDFMTMRSIGVMQELTRDDKRRARSARAAGEAELAQAGRASSVAALQSDTAMAWLDRHFQERMRELIVRQRAEAALQVEAADAAYRGGRGSQADVFAARAAVAQIDDQLREVELEMATARTRLARWIGAAAEQPLGEAPDIRQPPLDEDRLRQQSEQLPPVVLAASQEGVARADADLARANQRADWSVELMFSQRGPAYSNMVSVNLAIPLQIDRANRQDRELAARLAQAEQAKALHEDAVQAALAQAQAALQQWRSRLERGAHYDSALIPLAGERMRAALAAYRGGGGSLAEVLDARRMEIDTRMERLRLDIQAATLWAQLAYLLPAEQTVAAKETP